MASSISDLYRRQLGQQHPTRQAQPGFEPLRVGGRDPRTGALDPGPVGGFIASALSAFPEFLGAEPSQTAEAFRAQYPWAGFASELATLAIPYAGMYRLSRIPSMATRLEATAARLAGDTALHPIRTGAVREMVRYAPLEASRLAVGAVAYPENSGELFADVAFSTAIAGGLGAVGGIFRAGGRASRDPAEARVLGTDVVAAPTLQLQMLRAGAEPVSLELGREGTERALINEVLTETSGRGAVSNTRLPTLAPLEGARGRADTDELNAMFSLSEAPETGVRRQSLIETPEARLNTLNPGGQAQLITDLQAVGADIESVADLASSTFYPRRLYAVDNRGAAVLGRLTENPTLTKVNDNLWLGREDGEGLFVGLMRLGRGRPEVLATTDRVPRDIIRDAAGNPIRFYHGTERAFAGLPSKGAGTDRANIISYSTDPKFASEYAAPPTTGLGEASRVIPAYIRARRVGDFRNPAHVKRVRDYWVRWADKHGRSFSEDGITDGRYTYWEDTDLLDEMGWDAVWVREIGGATDDTLNLSIRANGGAKAVSPFEPMPARRSKRYGPGKVQAGEQFLLFKTNQPQRFSPQQHAVLQANYRHWATWRQAYQEPVWALSRMGQVENELLEMLTPQDFRDLHRFSRQTMVSKLSDRFTKRASGELGLTDSTTGRAFAESVYDMIAPTMFKQGKNSLYARFELTMRARVREVERQLNKMFFGQTEIQGSLWRHINRRKTSPAFAEGTWLDNWRSIPPDERELVIKAAISQTPAEDLAKLRADGVVSEATTRAVANLQALDRRYLNEVVLPELDAAGLKDTFNILEGYIMPTPRLGDFMQGVKDEAGKTVAIVSGKTGLQANRQAQAIVEEASARGRTWTSNKAELSHATEHSPSELDKLFQDTMRRIGTDEAADNIVRDAMKRLRYVAHPSSKRGAPLVTGAPGSFQERSGIAAAGVIELPSEREFLTQVRSHYERLGRYAAMQGWSERWGSELQRFSKYEPNLFHDLKRKRAQYLGIEGQITNTLNRTLAPVLGHMLGAKPATRIAQVTNELMYNFNLAWVNPTFALLNSLTPIMTALPQIAFTLRASGAANARLYQFMPAYGANGPVGVASHLSPLKVLWQSVRDLRDPEPALRQMIRELTDDGSLHAQLFEEFVGHAATGPTSLRESFRSGDYVQFFREGSTYMARKSEEFSRVVSAAAGFRLGRDVLALEGAQLKQFTRRFVETTNYMYGVVDRPRIFTGPLGSVFGLFKNWQMHYLGMMSHYAGVAWRENVWSPLLWQSAAALSIGGLGATPLRHLADGISNWHSGDPESYRWMLENWPNAADEIWFGLPAFLGVSLQTSASTPGTDVRNEITSLANVVVWERAKQLGTAVGSFVDQAQATGDASVLYNNPNVRDQLLAAISPRVISRAISTTEGDYVRSMRTGYPQVRELDSTSRFFHGLGMNQVEVERQQQAARELWRDQQRHRAMITGLGGAYAQALLRNDTAEAEQLIQRAILLGLPLSSVMRSAQNFQRREVEADSLSRFEQMEAGRWVAALDQAGP